MQLRRRVARRSQHHRRLGLPPHQRRRHAGAARRGARRRGAAFRAGLDRRGLRQSRADGDVHRGEPAPPQQPLRCQQGGRRSAGAGGASHARSRRRRHALLEQLRALPVSREADSRSSSPTLSPTSRCRSTATAARCGTGSTSPTTAAHSIWSCVVAASGEVYNIGGGNERRNVDDRRTSSWPRSASPCRSCARSRTVRGTIAATPSTPRRSRRELGWEPRQAFDDGVAATLAWYQAHRPWWGAVKSGAYRQYYERMYGARLRAAGAEGEP